MPNSSTPITRASLRRNRTFFERFNQTPPTTPLADSIHSSTESQPRLRRRFTFRRSLRKSVQNKRGGDNNDDELRSVFVFFLIFFHSVLLVDYMRRKTIFLCYTSST